MREFYRLAGNHGLKAPNVVKLCNPLIGSFDINFVNQGLVEWFAQDILEVAALAQRSLFTHTPINFDFSNLDNYSIPAFRTPSDIKLANILPSEPYIQNREKIFLRLTLPCSKEKDLPGFLLKQG